MARQIIDTTTNNGSYIGDPAKTAFEKVNSNFGEVYPLAEGALPKTGGTFTGTLTKVGVAGQPNFLVTNSGTDVGIGGSYLDWPNRAAGLQVAAQSSSLAYSLVKATNFGVKQLFGMDIYQGGSGPGAISELSFNFSTAATRHRFLDNGNMTIVGTLTQNSDYRIKDEIGDISPELAAQGLRNSRPIEYVDIQDQSRPSRSGFIAHELQENFPLLIEGEKDATREEEYLVGDTTPYFPGMEPPGYVPPHYETRTSDVLQNVNYIGMIPYLTAGWKHSDSMITELQIAIAELRSEIESLKNGN